MYTTKEKKLTIHFIFPGSQMSDSNSSSLSGGHIHPEGLKDYDEEESEDEEHNNHQYLVSTYIEGKIMMKKKSFFYLTLR